MRKILAMVAMVMLVGTAAGCRSSTEYGECKGLFTEDEKSPNLQYEVSTRNIVLDVIFSEALVIPFIGVGFDLWCPIGKKAPATK